MVENTRSESLRKNWEAMTDDEKAKRKRGLGWEKLSPEQRERRLRGLVKGRTINKGKHFSEEWKRKISESNKLYWATHPDELKKRQAHVSERIKQAWQNPEYRKQMVEKHRGHPGYWKGKHMSEQTKKKISEALKLKMRDKEYVKSLMKKVTPFPNGHETYLMGILEIYFPDQWRYTGNSEEVAGKIPDFIHNTKKLIIEYDGYWTHKNTIEKDNERQLLLENDGYKVLRLSEEDLKEPLTLVEKVRKFML